MQTSKKIWSVIDVIRWGEGYFREKGIDSPRFTVEQLLSKVLGRSRLDLYLHYDLPLDEESLAELKNCIQARVRGMPTQYIVGTVDFCHTTIKVKQPIIIPRPETEYMADLLIQTVKGSYAPDMNLRCLDICTGSGCIAVALAKALPAVHVTGVDINPQAIALARENAVYNKVKNLVFLEGDFFEPVKDEMFDIIVANPPYIPTEDIAVLDNEVKDFEDRRGLDGGRDGLTYYRRLAEGVGRYLTKNGILCVEVGAGQAEKVSSLLTGAGPELKDIRIFKDHAEIERVLMAMRDV